MIGRMPVHRLQMILQTLSQVSAHALVEWMIQSYYAISAHYNDQGMRL